MVFSWFYHENRLVTDFDYHIRNQRVKIHKYTKFEENRKIILKKFYSFIEKRQSLTDFI